MSDNYHVLPQKFQRCNNLSNVDISWSCVHDKAGELLIEEGHHGPVWEAFTFRCFFFVFSRAKELIMNIVQQRSRTEGAGSSMGEMSMATGPGNHAHVSVTVLHNMVKMTGCCILWRT
jgi:hypothetical protein